MLKKRQMLSGLSALMLAGCEPAPQEQPSTAPSVRTPAPVTHQPGPQPGVMTHQPGPQPILQRGAKRSLAPTCVGAPKATEPNPLEPSPAQAKSRLKDAVIVVGMDALEHTLVDRLVKEGKMPHFAQIGKQGFRSRMKISHPIVSPSVWTTLASGYPSEIHGIPNWTGSDGKPFRSMDVQVKRLWDVATENKQTTWVLNWLLTTPVSAIDGVMTSEELVFVGGLDTKGEHPPNRDPAITSQMLVSPASFCTTAAKQVPALDWVNTTSLAYQFDRYSVVRHPLVRDETTIRLFEALVGTPAPDLAMVYFSGADALSHRLWPFTDEAAVALMLEDPSMWKRSNDTFMKHEVHNRRRPFSDGETTPEMLKQGRKMVEDYYQYLDSVLGRIMKRIDPKRSTLLIVSDHGLTTAETSAPLYPAHSEHGILMGWGNRVKRNQSEPSKPRDLDVAPTIYALIGLPVANDAPGRLLSEHFELASKPKAASYATPSTLSGPDRPADFQRLQELQILGYVDEKGQPLEAPVPK